MRLAAAILALLALVPAKAAGPKIASINMCTDQLVLALADDEQILGLSPFARQRSMSWFHERAQKFPILSGQAEDVLVLKPDLVVTATFVKPETRSMLRRAGHRVEEFGSAGSIRDVKEQITRAGALFGHPGRAAAMNARIDAAAAAAREAAALTPIRVLPLQRRGWVSGEQSLITDVLSSAGVLSLGGATAGPVGARLSLEEIIRARPERLLLSSSPALAEDQGVAMLRHPALERIAPSDQRLILPGRLTVCAGPMLAEAFNLLTQELRRAKLRPRD